MTKFEKFSSWFNVLFGVSMGIIFYIENNPWANLMVVIILLKNLSLYKEYQINRINREIIDAYEKVVRRQSRMTGYSQE